VKELSLEELHEIGKEIRSAAMLRTRPTAVKFITNPEEFPPKLRFPYKDLDCKVTPCQAHNMVRTWGISLGMTVEDFVNMPCGLFWGFGLEVNGEKFDEERVPKYWVEEMDFFKDEEAGMNLLKAAPRIPQGKYMGIVMSPLERTRVMPDVVVAYGDPAQIYRLILALNFARGTGIKGNFSGAGALCLQGVIPTFLDREPRVFNPGGGERGIAMTQDNELGVVIPTERLQETVEGLKRGKAGAGKYPVNAYLHFTATHHPYEGLGITKITR